MVMENSERGKMQENNFTEADEMLLWSFIDGVATKEEQQRVMQVIAADTSWKAKYETLLQTNELFFSIDADQPSMRFTKNVMEQVAQYSVAPSAKTYVNKNIFRAIGTLFAILIIGGLVLVLKNIDWHSSSSNTLSAKASIHVENISHVVSGNTAIY